MAGDPKVGGRGFGAVEVVDALSDLIKKTPNASLRKRYLVTGGSGFIGSAVVKALVERGDIVRSFDNNWRGLASNLDEVRKDIELFEGDIRDPNAVTKAVKGVDVVMHLACVNGTGYFYTNPDLVLDVAVKGMVNVLDACNANDVGDLVFMSSSEVYQTPKVVPTDETAELSIPDATNPRYSYAGGKIISELMALNYGRAGFEKVRIVRPHNVYGPNMGWEHVVPQFIMRMNELAANTSGVIQFPIQGSGKETRSFAYISDMVDGFLRVSDSGEHLGIYHVGSRDEITVETLAKRIGRCFSRDVEIVPGDLMKGGTPRRCPEIAKVEKLGYTPKVSLDEGLALTAEWYLANADLAPKSQGHEREKNTSRIRNEQQPSR